MDCSVSCKHHVQHLQAVTDTKTSIHMHINHFMMVKLQQEIRNLL